MLGPVHRFARRFRRSSRRESGQALLLFAAGLAGLCGIVGLSVDIGHAVFTASDLQKMADAAALAGSQDLPSTDIAEASARSYAQKNGDATVAVSFEDSDTIIRVSAERHVDYTFLKVIGLSGKTLKRSAAARGKPIVVTGYNWENTAPFIIWGGTRQTEVNPGDSACALNTCVGKSYTFLDTNWMNASGKPKLPDWDSSESNNFKGDVQHGAGAPINHVGETFSVGGIGDVAVPVPGEILVIPIVDKAGGNSDMRSFRVAAWAIIQVDAGCDKNHCSGTILNPKTTTPPSGWVGGGSTQAPPSLTYVGRETGLVE